MVSRDEYEQISPTVTSMVSRDEYEQISPTVTSMVSRDEYEQITLTAFVSGELVYLETTMSR